MRGQAEKNAQKLSVEIYSVFTKSQRALVLCYFMLFIYLPHNNYKKYRKRRKKKWRGDLTETIGAYERLGLLELQARAV